MSNKLDQLIVQESKTSNLRKKEDVIYERRINSKYKEIEENDRLAKFVDGIDLSTGSEKEINALVEENNKFFEVIKDSAVFLNDDFKEDVPFFPGTATLILGTTGAGKSTVSANIAFQSLAQGKRVLLIVNEEVKRDCYNRITAISKKWHYKEFDEFTPDEIKVYNKYYKILRPRLTIIDNYTDDRTQITKNTNTVEGMEKIFQRVLEEKEKGNKYDVIIIDYYQNIKYSLEDPTKPDWKCQEIFADMIDQYKNVVECPIVILAQLDEKKKDMDVGDWKGLIAGRKVIGEKVTCAIQIKPDYENFRTEWIVNKGRWISRK
jgi:archaellum biogenesis ATPase FlaH